METLQRQMVGHGLLVIVAALLAGFMLGFGLIGGLEVMPGKIVSMPYYGTTAWSPYKVMSPRGLLRQES